MGGSSNPKPQTRLRFGEVVTSSFPPLLTILQSRLGFGFCSFSPQGPCFLPVFCFFIFHCVFFFGRVLRFLRCFSQYSLCTGSTVSTVLSVSTAVSICFHTFQLQLCSTLTDKTVTAVLAQGSSVTKTHHGGGVLWFANQSGLLRQRYSVLFRVGKLVTDWYLPKKVGVGATHGAIFCVLWILHNETNRNKLQFTRPSIWSKMATVEELALIWIVGQGVGECWCRVCA